MARISPSIDAKPTDHTSTVVTAAGIIGALYFGSEILVPIALAVLLSFAMAPAVKALQKVGLGRVAPVGIVVILTFATIGGLGALLVIQLRDFSGQLPRYETTVTAKLQALKGLTDSGGMRAVEEAISHFSHVASRGSQPESTAPAAAPVKTGPLARTADAATAAPTRVEIVSPAMGPIDAIMLVMAPLLHPLSMAVIVVIFVIFILLQREDLRNRAIRLFGASDLQRTTAAINDGGRRLSRYLLTQLAMNTGAGILVGTVLWVIGVPSPILLGVLFATARFIPYIGPLLGSVLPVLLATAVDPGWSMVLWTLVALAVIECVVGQFVEPFAYGHNTGLSPIALVVSATFWTVLWGPVGLFLSTPLTVCLVVLGRHVESLGFLDVLLGDQPPLTPAETFYQRMLANDPVEAADQAQRCLAEMSLSHYYDDVALPALLMAQDDAAQGRLDSERQSRIKAAALEVVDDLQHEATDEADPQAGTGLLHLGAPKSAAGKDASVDALLPEQVPDRFRAPGSILCIGGRGPLDDAAAAMLAQACVSHGIGATAESFVRLSRAELATLDVSQARMIVLSLLDGSSTAFLRFVVRRLRRHAPHAEIVVGAWWRRNGYKDTDEELDAVIRQTKVASFLDAIRFCFAERPVPADRPMPAGHEELPRAADDPVAIAS